MHKQRVYIDTSVIGGCFDDEFSEWSNKLFDEFIAGKKIALVSFLTYQELEEAPEKVKYQLDKIPINNIEIIKENVEHDYLADKYLHYHVVPKKSRDDAMHIAIATISNVDVLVSWNFKHIVNLNRILKYNSVNLMFGYKPIEIRNPKEVVIDEEDF